MTLPAPDTPLALPSAMTAKPAAKPARSMTSVRRYMTLGFFTLALLFGGLGGWAATTDLAGAVLAAGTVVVETNIKKIQHPTGGVVGAILVKNGDVVKAGDVLVRLDETVTRAGLQLVTKQIDELVGRKARLVAERTDAEDVTFPADLLAREASDETVAQILSGERALFASRTQTRAQQKSQLGERIASIEEEMAGTHAQSVAKGKEIELIAKELASLEPLEAQKLVLASKMMALRREAARLEGERAQLLATIGQSKGRIAEIEVQRLGIDSEAKSEVGRELREVEGKIVELYERRTAAEDQLKRIDIKSPVDGLVHQMTVSTIGGVISTSEPLMMIVPQGDRLVIEARIATHDIDQARSHETAIVRFPAFNQRTTPSVEGRVKTIAADLTHEPQTGLSYYVARIEIDDKELVKLNGQKLMPGMPAEIQIRTTARSALSYLTKPIEDQFAKAFKER